MLDKLNCLCAINIYTLSRITHALKQNHNSKEYSSISFLFLLCLLQVHLDALSLLKLMKQFIKHIKYTEIT